VNLSVRGLVAAGGDLTLGATVRGNGAKALLLRAVGPTLGAFGVSGALADPQLETIPVGANVASATNNDWGGDAALAATFAGAGAFPLPIGSKDAAFGSTLAGGGMTVRVTSAVAGGSGLALAEIYDRDPASVSTRLANVSVRGFAGTGAQALVPGFVIAGQAVKRLLIRAIGPTLATFGVSGVLSDPQLAVIPQPSTTVIASNDNWGGDAALSAAFAAVGAFVLPANSRDAAVIVQLPPGAYTVVVSGVGGATGQALVEIYDLDP
jgi:hypothetical protein